MHTHLPLQDGMPLPDSPQGCRARLATLQDEIAAIRIQIATTDLQRQVDRKALDPTWFHRAKTALRLKQQEVAQINSRLAALNRLGAGGRRDHFKDTLIEVLRREFDAGQWASLLRRAHTLHELRETTHG